MNFKGSPMKYLGIALATLAGFTVAAAPAPASAWQFNHAGFMRKAGAPGWSTDFSEYRITTDGLQLTGEKQDRRLWMNALYINADNYRALDIFHRGDLFHPSLIVYGRGEDGYGPDRQLRCTFPNNDRYELARTVLDMKKLSAWKGEIERFCLVVGGSGQGSTCTIYGMAFRRGFDTLDNGAFLAVGTDGQPSHWALETHSGSWRSHAAIDAGYGFPVWKLSASAGSEAVVTAVLPELQPAYRYRADILAKNAVQFQGAIVIYNDRNDVIATHPLAAEALPDANGFIRYQCTYPVPENAYRGELRLRLKAAADPIELADAMVENQGGIDNWHGSWIWTPEGHQDRQRCYFRKEFEIADPRAIESALLQATCDDAFSMEINNVRLFSMNNWSMPQQADITSYLQPGKNVITASGYNNSGPAALLAELKLTDHAGQVTCLGSDASWLCRTAPPPGNWRYARATLDQAWRPSVELARPPDGVWGNNVRYVTKMAPAPVLPPVDKTRYSTQRTVARINTDLNYPRLEVNTELLSPMIFGVRWRGDRTQSYVTGKAGNFRSFRLSWELSFEDWNADGTVNYRNLDRAVTEVLRAQPDAYIILQFRITPPAWWTQKHSDELVMFSDGTTVGADGVFASCASELWQKEISAKLEEVVGHIEKSWFGSRIIGYMPCNLRGPEWVLAQKSREFPDTSRPMRDYFRRKMREKYANDTEQLRKAWHNPEVTFDTIEIPGMNLRRDDIRYFLPGDRQIVFDYNDCLQSATVDAIMAVMDAIHRSAPEKLRVLYYGYLMALPQISYNPTSTSHYDLSRLLASGKVDVVASPVSYRWRHPGDISGCGSVEESFKLHHIVWLQEADNRTYLTAGNTDSHKVTRSAEASLAENRREFIYALVKRDAMWYYELGGGWYDNPYFHADFRKMQAIYHDAIAKPITWQTPVAAFFDEKSVLGVTLTDGRWGEFRPYRMHMDFQRALAASGLPHDMYELEDLYSIDLNRYKVLVLPNAWRHNPKLATFMREKGLKNNRMVIWIYAPGYGQSMDGLASMHALTGIKMKAAPSGAALYYRDQGRTIGLPGCGADGEVFTVSDPQAEVFGFYTAGRAPAAAIKKVGDGWSVYLPVSDYSGQTMRKLWRRVGVKPLIDTVDRVVFDGEYLGVAVIGAPSERTVTPPFAVVEAVDAFSGETLAIRDGAFRFRAKPGDARLFRLVRANR